MYSKPTILASHKFRLWFLLFNIVASWHHALFASTDSSNKSTDSSNDSDDDFTETKLCSKQYSIKQLHEKEESTESASLFRAYNRDTYEQVMIKVYQSTDCYRDEENIFNELEWRIDKNSIDSEILWDHFARLKDKCQHMGRPALVIELLNDVLLKAVTRHESGSSLDSGDGRSAVTAAKKARFDQSDLFGSPAPPINLAAAIYFKSYAYQLLVAVSVLHELGIYHLDLKPENMGLDLYGTLKLFDFGLASTEIRPYYAGTIMFSAPEMNLRMFDLIKENNAADKLDIWSVGCTIYEIFTGKWFSDGIEEFVDCVKSEQTKPEPEIGCKETGAYFYLKWSFGVTEAAQFREEFKIAEREAQERCPQIFTKCRSTLEIKNPPVYLYSNSEETHEEMPNTLSEQRMDVFNSDMSPKATYLDPSKTDPYELKTLLTDLLRFGFSERITVLNALTDYSVFRSFPHQDGTLDKCGNEALNDDSSTSEHE